MNTFMAVRSKEKRLKQIKIARTKRRLPTLECSTAAAPLCYTHFSIIDPGKRPEDKNEEIIEQFTQLRSIQFQCMISPYQQ